MVVFAAFKKAEESVIFAVASKTDFVGELGVPLKDLRDCSKDTVVVKWATAKLMSYPGPLQRSSQLQQQKAPAANRLVLSDGVPVVQVKPTAKGKVASQLTALAGSLKLRRNALVAKLGSSKSRKPSKFVIEESSDDDEEDIKLQGSSCRPLVDSTQAWHAGPTSQGKHAGGSLVAFWISPVLGSAHSALSNGDYCGWGGGLEVGCKSSRKLAATKRS